MVATLQQWFLEGYVRPDAVVRRVALEHFPAVVGRQAGLLLAGASANMSRYHAELLMRDGQLVVRDLASKNGTFVNRTRIRSEAPLETGDVVHFADAEFRVGTEQTEVADEDEETAAGLDVVQLPNHFPAGASEIARLLENGAIDAVYQPVVELATGQQIGQECLARGTWPSLPSSPSQLLWMAASIGREVELSELMRQRAVSCAGEAGLTGPTFVNIHPSEVVSTERLLDQLWALRKDWPELKLVLELHEGAITDIEAVESLHKQLRLLGIGLAYDDFGSGRARLMELTATPPRFLKFDIALVRDLDQSAHKRRRMVALLVEFCRENGIVTLAEGISRRGEAEACTELGFDCAQGYYFGEPAPLA